MGNIGAEIWRRFALTIDMANSALYLEPNDAIGAPFCAPRSGIAARYSNGAFEIIDIVAGSPGAEAGLVRGDIIVSIDGVNVSEGLSDWFMNAIGQETGTKVKFGLRRASGVDDTVTITLRELL
jgi:C-terminal processing protease CtpA/Prc